MQPPVRASAQYRLRAVTVRPARGRGHSPGTPRWRGAPRPRGARRRASNHSCFTGSRAARASPSAASRGTRASRCRVHQQQRSRRDAGHVGARDRCPEPSARRRRERARRRAGGDRARRTRHRSARRARSRRRPIRSGSMPVERDQRVERALQIDDRLARELDRERVAVAAPGGSTGSAQPRGELVSARGRGAGGRCAATAAPRRTQAAAIVLGALLVRGAGAARAAARRRCAAATGAPLTRSPRLEYSMRSARRSG